jgi:hypothetical protein
VAHPAAKHGTPQFPARRVGVKGDASRSPRGVNPGQAENLSMQAHTGQPAVTGPPVLANGGPITPVGGSKLKGAGPADANPCK